MQDEPEVAVLRLGHRPGRDDRMTTHVGLTARALGADRVIFPADATDAVETAREVTDRFGGPFGVEATDAPKAVVRGWDGSVVHLTMYGERVQDRIDEVRAAHRGDPSGGGDGDRSGDGGRSEEETEGGEPLLVVVGAEKVPFEVYEAADWNLAVTGQPHSEVAALAVFLDRLFEGRELDREWEGADRRVIPQATGKRVEDADANADAGSEPE